MPELDVLSFSAALAATAVDAERDRAVIPSGWAQGRATFGGLVLAQAMAAARRRLPAPRPCRALLASFPAPMAPGEVELRVRALRHGRAASHFQVEATQAGELGCVALLSYGGARPSAVVVPPPPRPPLPPADELPSLLPPGAVGIAPEFTRHLDYRLALGAPPYSGADTRELGGWVRFRVEPSASEEHLAGLVDAWPSPAVPRFAQPAPAASITWSMELLPLPPEETGEGWWLYHAELEAAAGGYAHSAARLWSPSGRLAALSRQSVAIFA